LDRAGVALSPGGAILFIETSDGGEARAILDGIGTAAGTLDISGLTNDGTDIGSLEGPGGIVQLGFRNLRIGTNNLDTTYAGQLRGGAHHPDEQRQGGPCRRRRDDPVRRQRGDAPRAGGRRAAAPAAAAAREI
jgi:hypothetical protein